MVSVDTACYRGVIRILSNISLGTFNKQHSIADVLRVSIYVSVLVRAELNNWKYLSHIKVYK